MVQHLVNKGEKKHHDTTEIMIAVLLHVLSSVYPNGYIAGGYFLFL
jgi:hypothetical protein